jgi:cation transport ATPase
MTTWKIPGTYCGGGKATVERTIHALDPATQISFNMAARRIALDGRAETGAVQTALADPGYPPQKHESVSNDTFSCLRRNLTVNADTSRTSADVAIESTGITLLGGNLMGIVRARKLARAALRNIQTEPVFRLFLQSPWSAHPGGATLPYHRAPGIPEDPGGDDEPAVRLGQNQCAAAAAHRSVKGHERG